MAGEPRDSVESVLSGTYTIERELGGGGMSRVFAATETALGRRVVIKMVPAELAASVNVDRFKREIQLAANLQHPHIVPVLAAGEVDGVPYYTMPFVDGESLRARIARGPVPIADAVSVLRDVAKALAYAHEHGVVHRDIKPDNVLMSGESAAVADFGIAKALVAAGKANANSNATSRTGVVGGGGGGGLTQVGMSIGTPMYMAPEQAAADPDADHRADIYSFGCLAYELLSGQPPFAGLPPHRLMVAHMTERPRPLIERRPDVPKPLADLVMRCLEKEPASRPQSAAELVRTLDAVGTASFEGLTALSRPSTLWKLIVAYVVAIAVVAVVAHEAVVGIGLPDWVMPASIVLLAIGAPVLLAVGYARRMTWQHSAAFGAAGLVAFVAVVGGFMKLRDAGVGPFGSLVAAGKLNRRDKILVADFTSTDTTLGSVVAEAVRADLGQSPIVQVVTPQTIALALQRMQQPANVRVDTAIARQVALREGAKAFVAGDVHSLAGGGFVVTMRLVSADSGQELTSLHASADGAKDLIPTIGGLTRRLRTKMGESLKHLQASAELAQVTTASLPALQAYSEGQRAMQVEGNTSKAIPLFRQAIKLDTGFASAYRALGVALANRNQDREERIRAVEKAYTHADRLPEVEHYLAIATYWTSGPKPDDAKAAAAYDTLLSLRPTNYAALNNLALIYARKRDFAKAAELTRRSIAASPTSLTAYGNLISSLAELGQGGAVDSTLDAELKASSNSPRVAIGRVQILFSRGQYDQALAFIDSIARAHPAEGDLQQTRIIDEESIYLTRGKLADALKRSSENAAMSTSFGSPSANLGASFDSAVVAALFLEQKEKALALVQAGLARTPLSTIAPLDRPYSGLAQVYSLAGRPDLAREMLADYDRNTAGLAPEAVAATRHQLMSTIAMAEHRYLDAAHEAAAADVGICTICMLPSIGMAYDLAQQPDSAIAAFTRYVESPAVSARMATDRFFLAGTYKRLGELLEAKGDREKAAHYYTKFIELWKDADPALQPKVAEARKRLARLGDTEPRRR